MEAASSHMNREVIAGIAGISGCAVGFAMGFGAFVLYDKYVRRNGTQRSDPQRLTFGGQQPHIGVQQPPVGIHQPHVDVTARAG